MKKIILLANIVLLSVNVFAAENLSQIIPKWKIHDKWIVRTWYDIIAPTKTGAVKVGEAPCDVTFEVINTNYIREISCYELLVTFPPDGTGSQSCYKLYYDKNNYKLLQVNDCYKKRNGKVKNDEVYDSSHTLDTSHINCGIPFDLPDFSKATNVVNKAKGTNYAQNIQKNSNTFTITLINKRTFDGRTRNKIIQKWEPGLPWPKETQKIDFNGKVFKSSFLKRIN